MRPPQRGESIGQLEACTHVWRQGIVEVARQPLKRIENETPLKLGRQAAGLLVDRDNPAGMNGLAVFGIDRLVLRIEELEATRRAQPHRPVEHQLKMRLQHIAQERLVEPGGADRPAGVAYERFENLEPRTPREAQAGTDDLAEIATASPGLSSAIDFRRLRSS